MSGDWERGNLIGWWEHEIKDYIKGFPLKIGKASGEERSEYDPINDFNVRKH